MAYGAHISQVIADRDPGRNRSLSVAAGPRAILQVMTVSAPSSDTPSTTGIRLDTARGRGVLAATVIASGMVFLDGTVVNVALPIIQRELAAPLSGLQWILDAYALFLAALLLVGGALGDAYGRKTLFLIGLGVFTLSSAVCGLAPNLNVLIAARAVQGIGGALLVPGSLAMIKAVIVPEDSGRAIGLWTGLSGVTAAIGPLVGGYLAGAVSWRTIFFVNVPLAVVAAFATVRYVPANRDERASRNLDWIGAATTVAGLGGLTFGLIEGPARGWGSLLIITALVLGVVCLLLFPLREARASHPMVPLQLFRSRNFSGSNLVTLGVYFCFSGATLFIVLNLQQLQGYSPVEAGLALSPITLALLFLSPRAGALSNRIGARLPMVVGPILICIAYVLFMLPGLHVLYPIQLLPSVIVLGVGMAIFITPLTTTVMGSVPEHSVGIASGVNNAVSRVAGLLAIAVLGAIIAARFNVALTSRVSHLSIPPSAQASMLRQRDRLADVPVPRSLPVPQQQRAHAAVQDAFLESYRWAMGTCAAICLVCAAISALTIRGESTNAALE